MLLHYAPNSLTTEGLGVQAEGLGVHNSGIGSATAISLATTISPAQKKEKDWASW